MKIFAGVVAAIFGIGTVAEEDKSKARIFAICFCVSMVIMYLA